MPLLPGVRAPHSRPVGRLASGSSAAVGRPPLWDGLGLLARSPGSVLTSRSCCPALCLALRSGSPLPSSQKPPSSRCNLQPPLSGCGAVLGLHPARLLRLFPPSAPFPPLPSSISRLPSWVSLQRVSPQRAQLGPQARGGRGAKGAALRREVGGGNGEAGGTGCTESAETPRATR